MAALRDEQGSADTQLQDDASIVVLEWYTGGERRALPLALTG